MPDEKSGEAVKVVVVKKDPLLTADAIKAFCKENLTGYKQPREVRFVDASPVYWTEPWERRPGESAQSRETWFFNCVVAIETTLEPPSLLEGVKAGDSIPATLSFADGIRVRARAGSGSFHRRQHLVDWQLPADDAGG